MFKKIAQRIESVHNDEPTKELELPKGKMLRSAVYLAKDKMIDTLQIRPVE